MRATSLIAATVMLTVLAGPALAQTYAEPIVTPPIITNLPDYNNAKPLGFKVLGNRIFIGGGVRARVAHAPSSAERCRPRFATTREAIRWAKGQYQGNKDPVVLAALQFCRSRKWGRAVAPYFIERIKLVLQEAKTPAGQLESLKNQMKALDVKVANQFMVRRH